MYMHIPQNTCMIHIHMHTHMVYVHALIAHRYTNTSSTHMHSMHAHRDMCAQYMCLVHSYTYTYAMCMHIVIAHTYTSTSYTHMHSIYVHTGTHTHCTQGTHACSVHLQAHVCMVCTCAAYSEPPVKNLLPLGALVNSLVGGAGLPKFVCKRSSTWIWNVDICSQDTGTRLRGVPCPTPQWVRSSSFSPSRGCTGGFPHIIGSSGQFHLFPEEFLYSACLILSDSQSSDSSVTPRACPCPGADSRGHAVLPLMTN